MGMLAEIMIVFPFLACLAAPRGHPPVKGWPRSLRPLALAVGGVLSRTGQAALDQGVQWEGRTGQRER